MFYLHAIWFFCLSHVRVEEVIPPHIDTIDCWYKMLVLFNRDYCWSWLAYTSFLSIIVLLFFITYFLLLASLSGPWMHLIPFSYNKEIDITKYMTLSVPWDTTTIFNCAKKGTGLSENQGLNILYMLMKAVIL